jgi:hypothetical protein
MAAAFFDRFGVVLKMGELKITSPMNELVFFGEQSAVGVSESFDTSPSDFSSSSSGICLKYEWSPSPSNIGTNGGTLSRMWSQSKEDK